jgi:hypothetical protein
VNRRETGSYAGGTDFGFWTLATIRSAVVMRVVQDRHSRRRQTRPRLWRMAMSRQ